MNHFEKLKREFIIQTAMLLFVVSIILIGLVILIVNGLQLSTPVILIIVCVVTVIYAFLVSTIITNFMLKPLKNVWLAVLHVGPNGSDTSAPNIDEIKLGRELVTSLVTQVYQLASKEDGKVLAEHRQAIIQAASIVTHLPIPLFVLNKDQTVVNASHASLEFCNIESSKLLGKPLYDSVYLEFSNEDTLEKWVDECQKNRVADSAYWQRVHVRQDNQELRQCDIAASYNRDDPSGAEFIITLFDRTEQYNKDDQDVGFVALAVHELRTPLTMLRGYIEVFEDELEGKLNTELNDFMKKMIVSAQQLAAFFNNILNVARVDQNQLSLKLNKENWGEIIQPACDELKLKASVNEQTIEVHVSPNLPDVAVDRFSIIEVINNLIDNAIKYETKGSTITINSKLNKQGLVETTIKDQGVGIPTGIIPHVFEKFYRSHRSSGTVGGTGLGLYISKAIVTAHGGEIWVQSTPGKGSTFGFTVLPASKLADELKAGNNSGIVRNAHGWIKNHNLYRR